ncbi:hypothetical protein [Haloarcula onubensis]|uniref:Membrane-spanning protein n=1 Tax=Haloarcula onubensis TaxID=2950539 RepID=A0ABU2FQA1_9EURY|nr:hypothetical protein [Halomicroarcula sp. S3CR25-11]MDS0282924.1 hypothetical protein [Halomicroarcula sp. S3CR25-11]
MTPADAVGLSEAGERRLVWGLQLLLCGLVIYGLATFRFGVAANAGAALAVTALPAMLRREYGYTMDAGLVVLITVAVFLHVVGALGPYRWLSWYDEVTHTVSSVLIAGVGYAVLSAFERHSSAVEIPAAFRGVFVVVFVLAAGVVWELLEFAVASVARGVGVGSPLVVYGIDDIVTDMLFNTVGAVVTVLWGTEHFDSLVPFVRRWL